MYACSYRRFGVTGGCVISVQCFGFHRRDTAFICIWAIQTSKVCIIRNNKSNQWLSIGSTINFELIYYAINLDIVSSFMGFFSDFDSIFLSMYC